MYGHWQMFTARHHSGYLPQWMGSLIGLNKKKGCFSRLPGREKTDTLGTDQINLYMKYPLLLRIGAGLLWIAILALALPSCNPPVEVPADPNTLCSVSPSTIATFFKSGTVTENGIVNPANSLNFVNAPNCGFYRWAEQMFLWVTSPAPSGYGGGSSRVFDSPVFFDLSPPDASGNQTLIPHTAGFFHAMAIRAAQVGPHHLPVLLNKAGKLIEIAPTPVAPDGKQLILNRAGQQVEVEEIRAGENGHPVFLGKDHQPIDGAHPLFMNVRPTKTIVERFMVGHRPIFVDQAADIVEIQLGEANDNAVLISQGGSLVYYIVMVNDVYAYFRTATADGHISAFHFPTSQSDLSAITSFARTTKNVTFPDSVAMAVELKTAWVLASTVPNPNTYITVMAAVPHYNKTANQWTLVPHVMDTVQLALVGLHFVGSASGRPEMIWSTFVHDSVAPDSSYQYRNSSLINTTVTANTTGSWLLCSNGSPGPYNTMRQTIDPFTGNINATMGNTIGPSDILTMAPWGAGYGEEPNPIDDDAPSSNAEIISINNNVRSTLIAGDPRKEYIFRGAMWTSDGGAPGNIGPLGNQFGTTALANVTMETFQQGHGGPAYTGANCFDCHNAANPGPVCDTAISHVWPFVKPLY